MTAEKLEFMRKGGRVQRFHTASLLTPDPVGHHTFNLIGILMCAVPGGPSLNLLKAAYVHDLPEGTTGDMPAPFKRSIPGLREKVEDIEQGILEGHDLRQNGLNAEEGLYLKLADSMDGMFRCLEELRMGNSTLTIPFSNFHDYVNELLKEAPARDVNVALFHDLFEYLTNEWRQSNGTIIRK